MHSWENITGKNMRRWLLHAAERLHRVIVPTTSSWDRTGRKGSMVRLYKAIECIHNRFISLFGWDLRINFTQHVFPFLPIPLQYCSMVVPSHCLPVYGCTGLPSFCAICFWHGHDVIHPGNHQFKVPYFLPSERDCRYQNVLDRSALPLKEWLHLVFFISDEFAILWSMCFD